MSLGSRWDLILICIGFGLSGLQVMFTMTHLPTLIALNGFSSTSGTWLLVILSGSSFLGSYVAGHLCDEIEHRRLLAWIYLARAVLAALFLVLPGDFWSLTSYFFLLGLVWMSTFPLVTGLIAELFGVHKLAVIFGYVFLSHQIGGFIGTWIGGIIAEQTGSYSSMFPLMCGGCLLAAALTTRISKRDSLAIN